MALILSNLVMLFFIFMVAKQRDEYRRRCMVLSKTVVEMNAVVDDLLAGKHKGDLNEKK